MKEKKEEFRIKNREEIIDTFQLRLKEKKILISLIILFLLAGGYEFSGPFLGGLFQEEFDIPEVGMSRKRVIPSKTLRKVKNNLIECGLEFPQFYKFFLKAEKEIESISMMNKTNPGSDLAIEKMEAVSLKLWEFVVNPVTSKRECTENLEKTLKDVLKFLKLDAGKDFKITKLVFEKKFIPEMSEPSRNMFDFKNEDEFNLLEVNDD